MHKLDDDFYVAGQIAPDDLKAIAAHGIRTIINNRPDGEAPGQPAAAAVRAAAEQAGLTYADLPITGLSREDIDETRRLLAEAPGPILAFCASGTRSTYLWALARVGNLPAEAIEQKAGDAGYDLTPIRRFL